MKLNIGSGNSSKQGYASVDKYCQADYEADFINLPFPDNSIQEVYTSHTLEHLGKFEVPIALKELYRVLEPKGIFTIIVPNLEWCVKTWLQDSDKRGFYLDAIYGNQEHSGEYHKTGFTLEGLKKMVEDTGLKVDNAEYVFDHSVQSIYIKGVKYEEKMV